MNAERKYSIAAGILLLLGFSGIGMQASLGTVLSGPDFLGGIPGREDGLIAAACFQLLMAIACSGIVALLFPALRRVDPAWALWSLVLRSFETVIFIAAATFLLSFPALAHAAAGADAASRAALQGVASTMKSAWDIASGVLGIFAWSLGAAIYHVLFFKGKLIPRWLSVWGIVGAPLAVAGCVLAMLGIVPIEAPANTLLNLPLGLQEIPLALWLIVKGTRSSAATRATAAGASE
jgi:hypothetical protein